MTMNSSSLFTSQEKGKRYRYHILLASCFVPFRFFNVHLPFPIDCEKKWFRLHFAFAPLLLLELLFSKACSCARRLLRHRQAQPQGPAASNDLLSVIVAMQLPLLLLSLLQVERLAVSTW